MNNEIIDPNFIFKKLPDEYEANLKPVNEYMKQAVSYITRELKIPQDEAIKKIKEVVKNSPIKKPIVKYSQRNERGDTEIKTDYLTDYIKDVVDSGEVLVPSFTSYLHPSKNKSLHADFLSINIALRKQDKHNAFKFKQLGDKDKELYYNTLQKVRKVLNNSLSGAYASKSTILYNPSAHYTLTSITRSVASIGNSISESIIAGNKHFRSRNIVMNYITAILNNIKFNTVQVVVEKFGLHKPSPTEVLESILYSSDHYWKDPEFNKTLLEFLTKLNQYELCAILYVNDLFHMKKYNESFVRNMLTEISARTETGSTDNLKDLKGAPESINILTHHIWFDEIQGKKIDYQELVDADPVLLNKLASTTKNIITMFTKYRLLFRAFFITDVSPIGIAYIKDMLRDAIVLSDTDSTCGSYDKWVEWYFGAARFTPDAVGISATVMTINTQVMDHYIKIFAKNMNIEYSLVELLKMKNEYFWPVFTATNVSKHYFADTLIQEGNVFAKPDREMKGVHLIASAVDQSVVKEGVGIIDDMNKKLANGEKLYLYDYVKQAANIERVLMEKIKKGDTSIFKFDKIKDPKSYKQSKEQSPYIHHMLWESVFAEKYGNSGDPTYMVIKVPTRLNSKRDTSEFIANMKDREIADKLSAFMLKHNKDNFGTFRPPLSVVNSVGVPEEILEAIDMKRIVQDNMNQIYMVLESIGFYRKPDHLITEMGY